MALGFPFVLGTMVTPAGRVCRRIATHELPYSTSCGAAPNNDFGPHCRPEPIIGAGYRDSPARAFFSGRVCPPPLPIKYIFGNIFAFILPCSVGNSHGDPVGREAFRRPYRCVI
jgi:hypothetical protein